VKLIAITGAIAAGATTLGRVLVSANGWSAFFEADVEQANPFFVLYHREPLRYALHNQVAFLTQSAELHDRMQSSEVAIGVQDYTPFEHTAVYAHAQAALGRLDIKELELLDRLSGFVERSFITPDVLIYRRLSEAALVARVRGRGRPSEQQLSLEFLKAVRERFEIWANNWRQSPVITLEEDFDAVGDAEAISALSARILSLLR
jgi:deoxyadenosine/deoxycytidine kinase